MSHTTGEANLGASYRGAEDGEQAVTTAASGGPGALEVRWIVPGPLPRTLWRPAGRPRSRVDAYHDESLQPTASLKRRGAAGPWERKHCVDREHVVMFGAVAVIEAWVKERHGQPPPRPWTLVSKRIWRGRPGIEVVELRTEGERWWSVGLKLGPSIPPLRRLRRLLDAAATAGVSQSYPAWLLERRTSAARRIEEPGRR